MVSHQFSRLVGDGDPAVSRLVKLYTLHLAPEEILVAAVADFEDDLTTAEIEAAIRRSHDAIRAVQETPRALHPDRAGIASGGRHRLVRGAEA